MNDARATPGAPVHGFDLHALPIAVLVVTEAGLTLANRQWTELTGLSEPQSRGDGWFAAVHPAEREVLASCTRPGGHFAGGQVRLRHTVDGTEVWVQPQVRAAGPATHPAVVITMTEIGTLKAAEADLHYRARHDLMTGLLNKVAFVDEVDERLAVAHAAGQPGALFFLDLDGFKAVNDRRGHAVGDRLLVAVAQRLQAMVRSGDVVGRLGGDEFGVFQASAPAEGVGPIAERFVAGVSEPYALDGETVHVSASVGVALAAGATGAASILDRADQAMYRAKAASPGTWSAEYEEARRLAAPVDEPASLADAAPTAAPPRAPAEWDGPSWYDDDDDRRPAGTGRLRRVATVVAALAVVVLLAWVVRASVAAHSAAQTIDTAAPAATTVGTTPLPTSTVGVADGAARAPGARASTPPAGTARLAEPVPPTDSTPDAAPVGGAVRAAAVQPGPAVGASPRAPSGAAAGAPPAPLPVTTAAPPTAPPAAAPVAAAVPTAAPAPAAPVVQPPGTPAPTTVAPPPPPSQPPAKVTPAKAPTATPAPATFVKVVAAGDDPAQIAAWLQSIGEAKVYGGTKALHEQLPVGTTITVSGGAATLS